MTVWARAPISTSPKDLDYFSKPWAFLGPQNDINVNISDMAEFMYLIKQY